MKVSNVKGLANHDDPESCVGTRKGDGEALTGESAGWVLSREKQFVRDADPVRRRGRPQPMFRFGKRHWYPASSETPGTVSYTHLRAHETPEHLVCRLL